jgi:hypothetical protein
VPAIARCCIYSKSTAKSVLEVAAFAGPLPAKTLSLKAHGASHTQPSSWSNRRSARAFKTADYEMRRRQFLGSTKLQSCHSLAHPLAQSTREKRCPSGVPRGASKGAPVDPPAPRLEAVERGDRAESFFLGDDHVGRDIGQDRRLEEAAAVRGALAAENHLDALLKASAMRASTFSTAFMSINGPIRIGGPIPSARPWGKFRARSGPLILRELRTEFLREPQLRRN